jgi:aryl sulfotransferase
MCAQTAGGGVYVRSPRVANESRERAKETVMARPATTVLRTWHMDSRRWAGYRPRAGDVVIATYPKCGTTWMQQIVALLIFQTAEPRPVTVLSPWIDARFTAPIEDMLALIEAQTHRRFLKSHLPFDALPLYDEVRYIHVARDGLDAFMSWHNHSLRYKRRALLDAAGLADETIGRPYPLAKEAPGDFFRDWMGLSGADAEPDVSAANFFATERSYWTARREPNLLMVHYSDLSKDLEGEMRRIAAFLGLEVPDAAWPALVKAATFDAMKRDGQTIMPFAAAAWDGGHEAFINSGKNERWRDALSPADIALYRKRAAAEFTSDLDRWLTHGGPISD